MKQFIAALLVVSLLATPLAENQEQIPQIVLVRREEEE